MFGSARLTVSDQEKARAEFITKHKDDTIVRTCKPPMWRNPSAFIYRETISGKLYYKDKRVMRYVSEDDMDEICKPVGKWW